MANYLLPDGGTVSDGASFVLNNIQYPSNWLQFSSDSEREALGIEGPIPEPEWYDPKFYLGYDSNGNLVPRDHLELVSTFIKQVRTNANQKLAESDWMIIREQDNGVPVPAEWRSWRQSIRMDSAVKIAAIQATQSSQELAEYIESVEYQNWSEPPV